MRAFLIAFFLLTAPAALAQGPRSDDSEAEVRAAIAQWYEALSKKADGRVWSLMAPGFIDASPHYRHVDTGAASLGPRVYTSLAARALKFDYEVDRVRKDGKFAKVNVGTRILFRVRGAEVL